MYTLVPPVLLAGSSATESTFWLGRPLEMTDQLVPPVVDPYMPSFPPLTAAQRLAGVVSVLTTMELTVAVLGSVVPVICVKAGAAKLVLFQTPAPPVAA